MNAKELINKHQKCIEILEAVQTFEMLIKSAQENIDGFCGTFPELRKKYKHNKEIYQMCINRLMQRYENL
jgi:hypothetical protein